jgi:hypothetical protein
MQVGCMGILVVDVFADPIQHLPDAGQLVTTSGLAMSVGWAQSTLTSDPTCFDAYLALGVENYLLGIKPVVVRTFLRLGGAQVDKEKGIGELQLTADKGRLLQPFARLLLAVAALRNRDLGKAHMLLQDLKEAFPDNPLYGQELAKLESRPS